MNYLHFTEEDFAADDFFQRWVLEADSASESFWQNWLAEHPEKRPVVKKAQWLVQHISFGETWTPSERSSMWQAIQANLNDDATPVVPLWEQPAHSIGWWKRPVWVVAAGIAVILLSYALIYNPLRTKEIQTAYGEIRQITLADGSTVTLNAHSRLHFANDFLDRPSREVWVEGEAFFDVVKRSANGKRVPFVVHANTLKIQVLGTAFNVLNRRDKVDVALEHGSVKVVDEQNEQNTVMLKPGEKVSQSHEKVRLVKQAIQIDDYTAWKDKVILFKQKSLAEIADMLKDMYNLDVVIDNPALKQETFTGSFPADSAEVFFAKLQRMYPISIHKDGDVVHLK
ncbi:FecR family protein [Spirosoma panaciterrae]|uniref:FecR family protein n=1 Tax=Spirosoma panaciterrae TaxID=496058 RepID=UPI00037278EB|nr:FecR domain-containing protein [Spirosoma panaciterrae]